MAKIVKDEEEARAKGYIGQKSSGNVNVAEILREGKNLIIQLKELKAMPQGEGENKNQESQGKDFKSMQNPTLSDSKEILAKKKKPENNIKQSQVLVTINEKKLIEQLNLLLKKEVSPRFEKWTLKDLRKNSELVLGFIMPKILEGIKYAIEIKEVPVTKEK